MKKKEKALEYFRNKFNCSQAVFTVYGTELGLTENQCLKTACAFGGGMGRQQLTCGALTGALMALGLKYGKAADDAEDKKTETYAKARELFIEFKKIHGSVTCRELLQGFDLNDPDDHKRITDMNLFEVLCEKYISDSVDITEKL